MYTEHLLRVVVDRGREHRTRCRECGKPMIWRVRPDGRSIPLDEHALPVRIDRDAQTFVRYELFERDAIHMATCKKKQPVTRDRLSEAEARS